MATKSMSYDHPAYVTPQTVGFEIGAGSALVGGKFQAFTTLLLKSATIAVTVAGTMTAAAANEYTLSKVNGTTTTSVGFSGNLGTTVAYTAGTNVVLGGGTTTLTQGEFLVCKRGTDATAQGSVAYEFLLSPGANVTV